MRRLQRSFRWANVVLIFLTFFAYLSPYIHPDTLWLFAVLGLIYPLLLILNLFFIAFWLYKRRRYALLSFICILLGWNHFTAFVGLSFFNGSSESSQPLKVLSYNIFGFSNKTPSGKDHNRRWSEEHLLDFYQRYHPDIWCFQEFPTAPSYAKKYQQILQEKTPLKYNYIEIEKGLGLFSRYPIKPLKLEYFGKHNSINGYMIADVEINGQTIRLFNIHLQSNAVSRLAHEVAQHGQLREKETWLQIKGMFGNYRRTAALRSNQARDIQQQMQESPYPVILCGDFNDVPLSYAYHQLQKNMQDGFRQQGRGLGTTFQGSLPALRIDYILSAPKFPILDYQVIRDGFSDHYPVMSVLDVERLGR